MWRCNGRKQNPPAFRITKDKYRKGCFRRRLTSQRVRCVSELIWTCIRRTWDFVKQSPNEQISSCKQFSLKNGFIFTVAYVKKRQRNSDCGLLLFSSWNWFPPKFKAMQNYKRIKCCLSRKGLFKEKTSSSVYVMKKGSTMGNSTFGDICWTS